MTKQWSIRVVVTTLTILFFQFSRSNMYTAQTFLWSKQFGGPGSENGNSCSTDGNGNLVSVGDFSETADFDPGPGTFNLVSNGVIDVYISKLDGSGNFLWAKQLGGDFSEKSYSVATDGFGNVYCTGYFQSTVDFDPGNGVFNLTSVGNYDVFILKLDASGNFIWAKQIGGTSFEEGFSIGIDITGNICVTGYFLGNVDFNPGLGLYSMSANGFRDVFVLKLDPMGDFLWAKQIGGQEDDYSYSLSTDPTGSIYITGQFKGTVDFDPGMASFELTAALNDIFVTKLDPSGNFIWSKQLGGLSEDEGRAVTIDDLGNVFVAGSFKGTVDFDPGPGVFNLISNGYSDVFIAKLDASGSLIWVKQIGGISSEYCYSIVTDAEENIYLTGNFYETVDFDPSVGIFNLTSAGEDDIYISKLDASGNFIWAINIGGTSEDFGVSITLDLSGNIYTTGSFKQTVDFDSGSGIFNLTSAGVWDAFVHKMVQCETTFGTDLQISCGPYTWIDGNTYNTSISNVSYTLPNALGCDSLVTLNLTVINPPLNTVTVVGATLTSDEVGAAYQWLDCNNGNSIINGANAQSFSPQLNGSYAVIITENSCTDTSTCQIVNSVGLNQFESYMVNVYPNPSQGQFTFKSTVLGEAYIITNYLGELVDNGIILKEETLFDISSLPVGVYLFKYNGFTSKLVMN
jgi:hypothetical protein